MFKHCGSRRKKWVGLPHKSNPKNWTQSEPIHTQIQIRANTLTHTHTHSESNEMLEPFVWSLSSNGKLLWKLITNSWGQSFFGDNRVGAKLGWGSFPGYEFMGRCRLFKSPYSRGRQSLLSIPPGYHPPSLFFGCHAECVRVRVHFLVFSLPPWHFPKHSAVSSGSQMDFWEDPMWVSLNTLSNRWLINFYRI